MNSTGSEAADADGSTVHVDASTTATTTELESTTNAPDDENDDDVHVIVLSNLAPLHIPSNATTKWTHRAMAASDVSTVHSDLDDMVQEVFDGQLHTGNMTYTTIDFHEHPVIVGDNPAVSRGPPLTLDWEAQNSYQLNVDEYEEARPERRRYVELLTSRSTRIELLRSSGYSRMEIRVLCKPVEETKKQRCATNQRIEADKRDELWEKISRKVSNWVTLGARKRRERRYFDRCASYWRRDSQKFPATADSSLKSCFKSSPSFRPHASLDISVRTADVTEIEESLAEPS